MLSRGFNFNEQSLSRKVNVPSLLYNEEVGFAVFTEGLDFIKPSLSKKASLFEL